MKIYVFILITCFTGCINSKDYDKRLLGTWKSNKDETIKRYKKTHSNHIKDLGKEKFEFFKSMFGKLIVTYDKYEYKIKLGDYESKNKYSVVEKGKDYVVIKDNAETILGDKKQLIKFVDNGYWLKPNKDSKFMEKFDKITPNKENSE